MLRIFEPDTLSTAEKALSKNEMSYFSSGDRMLPLFLLMQSLCLSKALRIFSYQDALRCFFLPVQQSRSQQHWRSNLLLFNLSGLHLANGSFFWRAVLFQILTSM